MKDSKEFLVWRNKRAIESHDEPDYASKSLDWMNEAVKNDYSYMFEWMGVPVIQFPSDLMLISEAVFRSRANKIIEIGVARGGTTLFLASLLRLFHEKNNAAVIGVDILFSKHTKEAIQESKLKDSIVLIEGNSLSNDTFNKVKENIEQNDVVLVILDSDHTKDHVFQEMIKYSPIVTTNSFLIVMDTAIEYLDPTVIPVEKKWSRLNNPKNAVEDYLKNFPGSFEIDESLNSRSMPGAAKDGFLRKS
jgi:cephalosporin hydroxylase